MKPYMRKSKELGDNNIWKLANENEVEKKIISSKCILLVGLKRLFLWRGKRKLVKAQF